MWKIIIVLKSTISFNYSCLVPSLLNIKSIWLSINYRYCHYHYHYLQNYAISIIYSNWLYTIINNNIACSHHTTTYSSPLLVLFLLIMFYFSFVITSFNIISLWFIWNHKSKQIWLDFMFINKIIQIQTEMKIFS